VGKPGEGAVTIEPALKMAAAETAAATRPSAPRPPSAPIPNVIYVVAGDGMLHQLYISNGTEPEKAIPFVLPNSRAEGLIVMGQAAYVSTHACSGAAAGIWRLDIATGQVTSWKPESGDIAGSEGPAFGPDGTVYAATTKGDLVALDPQTLTPVWRYSGAGEFASSPVVFAFRGKTVAAAAARDGRFHLVSGGSALAISAPHGMTAGAVSTWQSIDGTRWLVAAIPNSIVAWKVVDRAGSAVLEPAWRSQEMIAPLPPMILSGVVFAVAGGSQSAPAVLHALDGTTGRRLWDSGTAITSFARSGGLSGGASQIYFSTEDGMFYAFGFPTEH
jgi:outer membrane protein assembly factor BamB